MANYRNRLPQLNGKTVITDGGMETTLIFHEGVELPLFIAFPLIDSEDGRARIAAYFRRYLDIARASGTGLILETPTWRASADWGAQLGYDEAALARVYADSVAFMQELREDWETPETPLVVSGCIGPRGDGYSPETLMEAAEARIYHAPQVSSSCCSATSRPCSRRRIRFISSSATTPTSPKTPPFAEAAC